MVVSVVVADSWPRRCYLSNRAEPQELVKMGQPAPEALDVVHAYFGRARTLLQTRLSIHEKRCSLCVHVMLQVVYMRLEVTPV